MATRYAVTEPVLGTSEEKSTVALSLDSPSVVPLAEASVPSENKQRKGRGADTVTLRPEYENDNDEALIRPAVCRFPVMSSRESRVRVSALSSTV